MSDKPLPFFKRIKYFQIIATMYFLFFMTTMGTVVYIAYNRQSGKTGLDMAKVQMLRYEASKKTE